MGTAIAIRERTPTVPDTPTDKNELRKELRDYQRRLQIIDRLQKYTVVFEPPAHIQALRPYYFLLNLNFDTHRFKVVPYRRRESEQASKDYLEAERAGSGHADVVLVSVESLQALKRAYPNYFLDTDAFIRAVRAAIA